MNLAISKLFTPALFTMPLFFKNINSFFLHSLCGHFSTNKFLSPYFTPIIHNDQFYFAFATYIVDQNVTSFVKTDLRALTQQFISVFENTSLKFSPVYNMLDCIFLGNKCEPCEFYTYMNIATSSESPLLRAQFRFCKCGVITHKNYMCTNAREKLNFSHYFSPLDYN